jgi:hypothetical protein
MRTTLFAFKILIVAVCIFNVSYSFAQQAVISGHLYNRSFETRVHNITVTLKNEQENTRITFSDSNGFYEFKNVAAGNYTVLFSGLGFQSQSKNIMIEQKHLTLSVFLSETSLQLPEVTVKSSLKEADQINLISKVDKVLRPTSSAQDLLRLVPGLFIAQHAGGGKAEQIFIRGFDVDHGTDFQISIDGLPVNMVSHAHGQGYADFHFVIPETVDELRVYKGPYNARFGDFATAGAGEFTTKNAIGNSTFKFEYGQFDTYRGLAMLDLLKQKHLFTKQKENLYIAAEYVFTNSYFESPQDFKRHNVFLKYNGLISKKTSLNFSASTFKAAWDASGQVPERAVRSGIISRFGSIDDTEGGNTDRSNINLKMVTAVKENALLKNQVYFVNYNFNLFSNFTFYLEDTLNGDGINQDDRRNIYGYLGTYEHTGKFLNKNTRSVAGWGTRIDHADIGLRRAVKRALTDTIVDGKLQQQNAYAYLDETISLTSEFSLNAGLRFDYFDFGFMNSQHDSLSGRSGKMRLSPKLSGYYTMNNKVQLFLKSGIGFHSNDARDVVVNKTANTLPRAYGYEAGSTFKPISNMVINVALYGVHLERELVYVGDAGEVEEKGATRRLGGDLSVRYQFVKNLFADVDVNMVRGRFTRLPKGENFIPLAPAFTSTGGISYKRPRGINGGLRYRYIDNRPANETNSVVAKGYFLLDAVLSYARSKYQLGISAENLLNVKWNQAQFDTESRLRNEAYPVSELHFTPGNPFFIKGMVSVNF